MGKGGEREEKGREGRDGKFALAPSKYIWIDAAAINMRKIEVP